MTRYTVVTPEYGVVVPITDEGLGPTEYVCDVVEVEAESARDAKVLAVQIMRANRRVYRYLDDVGVCPFTGLQVFTWEGEPDPLQEKSR